MSVTPLSIPSVLSCFLPSPQRVWVQRALPDKLPADKFVSQSQCAREPNL